MIVTCEVTCKYQVFGNIKRVQVQILRIKRQELAERSRSNDDTIPAKLTVLSSLDT